MRYDVAIVGAGIIGSAAAYELAARGLAVVLFDALQAAGKATLAATGLLVGGHGANVDSESASLLRLSLRLFEPWVLALEQELGERLGYERGGVLRVAATDREAMRLMRAVEFAVKRGEDAQWLTEEQAREQEPLLAQATQRGVARFVTEGKVDPGRLLCGLQRIAVKLGVWLLPEAVTKLERVGARWRVRGEAHVVEANEVVLAAGFASVRLAEALGISLPLYPVRGVSFECVVPSPVPSALTCSRVQVVSRAGMKLVVGSTLEKNQSQPIIAPRALAELKRQCAKAFPWMGRASIVKARCGIRPGSKIGRPVVGRVPRYHGLTVAVGHYRSGLVLAPLTSRTIREIVLGEPLSGASEFWRWPGE